AKKKLESLINNQEITCQKKGTDKYGRIVAICFLDHLNLNAEMVKSGYAVSYGKEFSQEEAYAKAHKLGIWKSRFTSPIKLH
ncbi:MAG: thermonuclease family protein, partial [Burkholderiales bacterium]